MATIIDFSSFTFTEEQIRNINELVFENVQKLPELDYIHQMYSGIVYDKEIGFITGGGLVGKAKQGCSPTPHDFAIPTRKVVWRPKAWEVYIEECAQDLENTMVVYAMNRGTRVDDLTDTDYMAIVVEVLTEAVKKAMYRFIWFNDTDAAAYEEEDVYTATLTEQTAGSAIVGTVYKGVDEDTEGAVKAALADKTVVYLAGSAAVGNAESGKSYYSKSATKDITINNGGTLTEGIDEDYFNVLDGLFKQLRAIVANNAAAGVTIVANSEDSKAEQDSEFGAQDAYDLLSAMYYKAPIALRNSGKMRFLVTQSVADRYQQYLTGKGIESEYDNLVNGLRALKFLGVEVIPLSIWDEMIRSYQDLGSTYYKPHRALLTMKEVLGVGTPSEEAYGSFDVFYDKKSRTNNIYLADKIDAKILNDGMLIYAE